MYRTSDGYILQARACVAYANREVVFLKDKVAVTRSLKVTINLSKQKPGGQYIKLIHSISRRKINTATQ